MTHSFTFFKIGVRAESKFRKKVVEEWPTILALSEHHISNDLLTREFRH